MEKNKRRRYSYQKLRFSLRSFIKLWSFYSARIYNASFVLESQSVCSICSHFVVFAYNLHFWFSSGKLFCLSSVSESGLQVRDGESLCKSSHALLIYITLSDRLLRGQAHLQRAPKKAIDRRCYCLFL